MKKVAKQLVLNFLSLWLVAMIFPSISYQDQFINLLIASIVFTLLRVSLTIILKLLFTPINLLTFGFLSWIPDALTVWVLTLLSHYQIKPITIVSVTYRNWTLPTFHLGFISSIVAATLCLYLTRRILKWGLS